MSTVYTDLHNFCIQIRVLLFSCCTHQSLYTYHDYLAGTKVIIGHYLNYQKSTRDGLLHKKIQEEAIVPSECILYCGIDLQTKKDDLFLLAKEDHDEDIICSIALNFSQSYLDYIHV